MDRFHAALGIAAEILCCFACTLRAALTGRAAS
jgi:hypothetical protein